mgnify:CR=1 FL=1
MANKFFLGIFLFSLALRGSGRCIRQEVRVLKFARLVKIGDSASLEKVLAKKNVADEFLTTTELIPLLGKRQVVDGEYVFFTVQNAVRFYKEKLTAKGKKIVEPIEIKKGKNTTARQRDVIFFTIMESLLSLKKIED